MFLSEQDIRIFAMVFWLRNRPSTKYVRNQSNGGGLSKMYTGAYRSRGKGVSGLMCTQALTLTLFMFLSYGVLFYLQKFKRRMTLQKRRRYNFSLRNVIMRCCNDVVFATSSDVSIATIWQLQRDVGQPRRNDVVKLCLMENKCRQRNCIIIKNPLYSEIIVQLIEFFQ